MKKKKAPSKKRTTAGRKPRRLTPVSGSPIPASKLLRAEATRLDVLRHAMPDKPQNMLACQIWGFNLAAAWLDALGAPERIERYVSVNDQVSNGQADRNQQSND